MAVADVELAADGVVAAGAQEVDGVTEAFDAADDGVVRTGDEEDGEFGVGDVPSFFCVDFL